MAQSDDDKQNFVGCKGEGVRDNYSHRWVAGYDSNPVLGPPIPSLLPCTRCGCCSLGRDAECVGPCTPCGHHLIDDCPNCEDKEREILELRRFIEGIVDGAKALHIPY